MYTPHNLSKDGVLARYGDLNVVSGSSVQLQFALVESATSKPAMVRSLAFSIVALDTGAHGQSEFVTTKGFSNAHVSSDTEIERRDNTDGSSTFKGTSFGDLNDVPSDPKKLSKLARARTVSFLFEDVSTFDITFGVTAGRYDQVVGRNFLFAGESSLLMNCPVNASITTTTSTTTTTVTTTLTATKPADRKSVV